MKRVIIFTVMVASFMFVTVVSVTCKKEKDPCEDVVCYNGGHCEDGTCVCAAGYEGADCKTESREKFLGTWYGYNHTDSFAFTTDIIVLNESITTVKITDLEAKYLKDLPAKAIVDNNNISIPRQQSTDWFNKVYEVEGITIGTLKDGKFSIKVHIKNASLYYDKVIDYTFSKN